MDVEVAAQDRSGGGGGTGRGRREAGDGQQERA